MGKSRGAFFMVMFCLSCAVLSAEVSVPYGEGAGKVGFYNDKNHPKSQQFPPLGPLSFRFSGGEFWIADSLGGKLIRMDGKGKILSETPVALEKGEKLKIEDFAISVDESGKPRSFFALNSMKDEVIEISPAGKVLQRFGKRGKEQGSFIQVNRIEIGPSGKVYVSDVGRRMILVFSAKGEFIWEKTWERSGFAIDGRDNLCFLSWNRKKKHQSLVRMNHKREARAFVGLSILPEHMNARLWWIDQNGNALITFTAKKPGKPEFMMVLVDPAGKILHKRGFAPPFAMTRFLEPTGDGKSAWLAAADFSKAPEGTFRIGRLDLEGKGN